LISLFERKATRPHLNRQATPASPTPTNHPVATGDLKHEERTQTTDSLLLHCYYISLAHFTPVTSRMQFFAERYCFQPAPSLGGDHELGFISTWPKRSMKRDVPGLHHSLAVESFFSMPFFTQASSISCCFLLFFLPCLIRSFSK
jgi:hypothetical protein